MASNLRSRPRYDLPTAITFLIFGLGIGSFLAMLLAARPEQSSEHTVVLPFPARPRAS
jgi:hypothetical protein